MTSRRQQAFQNICTCWSTSSAVPTTRNRTNTWSAFMTCKGSWHFTTIFRWHVWKEHASHMLSIPLQLTCSTIAPTASVHWRRVVTLSSRNILSKTLLFGVTSPTWSPGSMKSWKSSICCLIKSYDQFSFNLSYLIETNHWCTLTDLYDALSSHICLLSLISFLLFVYKLFFQNYLFSDGFCLWWQFNCGRMSTFDAAKAQDNRPSCHQFNFVSESIEW